MLFPKEAPGSTIYEISVKKTGNFAFQNIIDYMKDSAKLGQIIVQALQHSVVNANTGATEDVILPLIEHERGTHVIQRIIKTFDMFSSLLLFIPSSLWTPIYSILLEKCYDVARDRNGSMVLRLCYGQVDIDRKEDLARVIIQHAKDLSADPVGNYVVQHILMLPDA